MSLFIHYGSSGAGKTTRMIEDTLKRAEKSSDRNFFIIVPEQHTLNIQQKFIHSSASGGIMNIDVLSFSRLSGRILDEKGGVKELLLEDTGKSMIVRKLLLEHKDQLKVYGGSVNKQGFVDEIKSVIAEFSQYDIDDYGIEDMLSMAEDKPLLHHKLEDIRLIYSAFRQFLKDRFITGEELLDKAAEAAEGSNLLKGSILCLDGFTGFTPSQMKLLRALLTCSEEVHVTLTMPYGEYRRVQLEHNLFYLSFKTATALKKLSAELDIPCTEVCEEGIPVRFRDNPALAHLEANLFRPMAAVYKEAQDSVVFMDCRDRAEETFLTVCEIKSLLRKGVKGSEIAIVSGDVSGYGRLLAEAMKKAGISCFVDEKQGIIKTSLVELIRSGIEVAATGYSYESVFRFLRSGIGILSERDTDELENYCLALGIRGRKKYSEKWDYSYKTEHEVDLEGINRSRARVYDCLSPLTEVLCDRKSDVRSRLAALYEFAERAFRLHEEIEAEVLAAETDGSAEADDILCRGKEVPGTGKTKTETDGARAETDRARVETDSAALEKDREEQQLFSLFADMLDRLEGLLGDEILSASEFSAIVDTGFSEIKLRPLPESPNSIIIGDIERSRLEGISHLFFLGVNDTVIPKQAKGGGVLSDADRMYLKEKEFDLAPTVREQSYLTEFYLYLNMTKPSRRLYLSCCSVDDEGKQIRPSYIAERVKRLFTDRTEAEGLKEGMTEGSPDRILGVDRGRSFLMEALREGRDSDRAFAHTLITSFREEEPRAFDKLIEALCREEAAECIDEEQAGRLYGSVLKGSITRLEAYARCAFAHFIRYGLKLEDRREFRVSAADIGSIYHKAIELFGKSLKEQGLSWKKVNDDEKRKLVEEGVLQAAAEYGTGVFGNTARNEYTLVQLTRIVRRTIDTIQQQIKAGSMEPAFYEEAFNSAGRYMDLTGKIDRLDIARKNGRLYLRVVDYKSGSQSFSLQKLFHGLSLQLGVYMTEGMELVKRSTEGEAEVAPAGMYYYKISDPFVDRCENPEAAIMKALKLDGLSSSDISALSVQDSSLADEAGELAISVTSEVINVATTTKGILNSRSDAVAENLFEALGEHLEKNMRASAESIMKGDTKTLPFKLGTETGCDYCEYSGICCFGRKKAADYRELEKLKEDEIFSRINEERAAEEK